MCFYGCTKVSTEILLFATESRLGLSAWRCSCVLELPTNFVVFRQERQIIF